MVVFVYVEQRFDERDPGFISDVESLTYRVVDSAGVEQVPTTAVDLVIDRTRTGTYAPQITIAANAALGEWRVEWVAERVLGEDPQTRVTPFRVLIASEPIPDGYAYLSDMRRQGVPNGFCDEDVVASIERASRFVEQVTMRFFSPKWMERQHDGTGRGVILNIEDPIIGIEDLEITFSDFRPIARLVNREQVRVYNRHLRHPTPLLNPDDRDSPKISILRVENPISQEPRFPALTRRFTQAQLNVQLQGWFGYTEFDGSPLGRTPQLLSRVVMMLAMRDLRPMWNDFSAGRRGQPAGPIKREKTRDQDAEYATGKDAGAAGSGWITGDPEIDRILSMYMPPVRLSSV